MGSGQELQGRLRSDGIDRHPHRHVVEALDVVVGLILVPRGGLLRAGLLHEHVVVVEPHDGAAHQGARDVGGLGVEGDLPVLVDALPVAEVLDEASRVVVAAGDAEQWTRFGEVALDAAADGLHLIGGEQPADDDAAVDAVGGDVLRGYDTPVDRAHVGPGHSPMPRSRMSLATWPVAFTL